MERGGSEASEGGNPFKGCPLRVKLMVQLRSILKVADNTGAHTLSVMSQKISDDAVTVYIDTENTFRPERITQFAKGAGMDPEKVLKNIQVARA